MNLTVKCVSEVNAMVDYDGVRLIRKATIQCSLAHKTNSCREITQLFQQLQEIALRYPIEFAEVPYRISNTQHLLSAWSIIHELTVLYTLSSE